MLPVLEVRYARRSSRHECDGKANKKHMRKKLVGKLQTCHGDLPGRHRRQRNYDVVHHDIHADSECRPGNPWFLPQERNCPAGTIKNCRRSNRDREVANHAEQGTSPASTKGSGTQKAASDVLKETSRCDPGHPPVINHRIKTIQNPGDQATYKDRFKSFGPSADGGHYRKHPC
jgi:hypothetical protein